MFVDVVTNDTCGIVAKLRAGLTTELGARGQKGIVADAGEKRELCAGNMSGEKFGAGLDGNDSVDGASGDRYRNGDFLEGVGGESWAEGRGNSKNSANARITMRLGSFFESGLKL